MNLKEFNYIRYIGWELGNVTLLKKLGQGTMGIVFIGFQKSLKRLVAVKVLPKEMIRNQVTRKLFKDEALIVAGLSHSNIIPIFETGETQEFYYQINQLIRGSDLETIINRTLKHPVPVKRFLPLRKIVSFMEQILDGLGYAHEEGITHQDIKPANILIEAKSERPLITDFGIARARQIDYNLQNLVAGTLLYMAPEQAAGKETDARADIYSCGVMLFKLIAGVLPIRTESSREMHVRKVKAPETIFLASPSSVSPFVNNDLEMIILKAIESNIDSRYQTCSEFQKDLILFRNNYLINN